MSAVAAANLSAQRRSHIDTINPTLYSTEWSAVTTTVVGSYGTAVQPTIVRTIMSAVAAAYLSAQCGSQLSAVDASIQSPERSAVTTTVVGSYGTAI